LRGGRKVGRFEGTGELPQRGQLHAADGELLTIDGLSALAFGNGAAGDLPPTAPRAPILLPFFSLL